MPSISLAVSPTSGSAPLMVNVVATVTGPFQGLLLVNIVDVTYANPHKDEPSRPYYQEVNVPEGSTDVQFPEISAGTSEHTYKFYGYLETDRFQFVAASDPITVVVS